MRQLVFVILCGWPSGYAGSPVFVTLWMTVCYAEWYPAYQTAIHTEWQIPGVALIQLFLLMMGT